MPIVNFFAEIHEKFTHFIFEGDIKNEIETEYSPSYIPEGFTKTSSLSQPAISTITYSNGAGQLIEFSQIITDALDLFFDAENGTITEVHINEFTVEVYKTKNLTQTAWVYDAYAMTLTCYGDINDGEIYKIIESAEKK